MPHDHEGELFTINQLVDLDGRIYNYNGQADKKSHDGLHTKSI